jgi:hypothetical protein
MLGARKGNNHGRLITVGELDAVEAIGPYLVREFLLIDGYKSPLSKEAFLVRKPRADPPAGPVRTHGKRPDLGEAFPTDMQRAYADDVIVLGEQGEIAYALIEIIQ